MTWTATASGVSGPYTYKFWVFNGTAWSVGQNWSAASSWTWMPPTAGTSTLQVWARNAGSVATYDAWRASAPYAVTAAAPLSVTLELEPSAPAPAGTQIEWTATATGGVAPYQYQFWKVSAGGFQELVRD